MYFHWQNLNEGRTDSEGNTPLGIPNHGRAWFRRDEPNERTTFRVEWNLWSHFCGVKLGIDPSNGDITLHCSFPPVSLWFSVEALGVYRLAEKLGLKYDGRDISFSVHDWSLWWCLWKDDDSWSRDTPRWRQGSFNIPNWFLGKQEYQQRVLSEEEAVIPLPEENYPAHIKIVERKWWRARWPWARVRVGAEVELKKPIPIPGKGENSYDIDDDAIYSSSMPATSVAEAIGKLVSSAMSTRFRHGGRSWVPEKKDQEAQQ